MYADWMPFDHQPALHADSTLRAAFCLPPALKGSQTIFESFTISYYLLKKKKTGFSRESET
jgi:hypothetical protein